VEEDEIRWTEAEGNETTARGRILKIVD